MALLASYSPLSSAASRRSLISFSSVSYPLTTSSSWLGVVLLLGHFAQGQGVLPLGNQLVMLFDLVLQALYLTGSPVWLRSRSFQKPSCSVSFCSSASSSRALGMPSAFSSSPQGGLQRLELLFILVVLDNGHISSLLVPVNFLSLTIIPKNSRL